MNKLFEYFYNPKQYCLRITIHVTTYTIMSESNSLRAKNTGIGATNMWTGTHIRFPENDMKIPDFLKSFFKENDIHTRADLNTWLKGPRSKLYDIVEKSCSQHWAEFINKRSAKSCVRASYGKILPGYKVFQQFSFTEIPE